ncbi:UDP-glucose/GDP-mannose dehydrogenase family protein [Candidatus Parcubacteria bacterium]|nr:UDP-glucose/GDP-mannose dehydrogenase family protein [Candidatus Parcubacteria bacterium]
MTVTVIGTGYVGVTTATILANAGYTVYAIDISEDRLQALREGRSFFYEEGLNPLVKKAVDAGSLIPTTSYAEAIPKSSFVFSCVGTPDNPDGSSNLTYIYASAKEAAKYIAPGSIYVQKSTVPVGTGRKVLKSFEGKDVSYVSNPEFLREGTALLDTLFFDRIVVGGSDQTALDKVIDLYKAVEKNQENMAKIAGIKPKSSSVLHLDVAQGNNEQQTNGTNKYCEQAAQADEVAERQELSSVSGSARQQGEAVRKPGGEYIKTNLDSAELIKVTANAFLALKISFANSIAQLADKTEADVVEVMNAVGADPRIGRAFLNAGRGYGGGCFPKDVAGLISSAASYGVDMDIMQSASQLNEEMPGYIVGKATKILGNVKGKKAAVLGLSFKAGTSDARKSPGVKIANLLSKAGAQVRAYDPEANGEAKADLARAVGTSDSLDEVVSGADLVFIATDWPQFKDMDLTSLAGSMNGKVFVDCMNCIDPSQAKKAGLHYIGVGR